MREFAGRASAAARRDGRAFFERELLA